ncbi:MAG: acyltransferase [Lachnospiraceae bacterium]|nr:acyltransferase [Lachnospiraceae bacterium]
MRRHYIDNLRNFTIMLLFPVHTFMVWNDFGFKFYIWMGENRILSTLIVLVNPWFMPMLFVLAGMSARYALDKRTVKEFVMQRVHKLLIPFVFGMALLVPFQSLYARKFYDGYAGSILEHWKYFYTHCTDMSGYDGAFTPGHLWFILFLLLISIVSLIIFHYLPYEKSIIMVEKMPAGHILLLFVPIWLMYYLGNFGGFSLGKNLALYLAGYYVLSNDVIMDRLEKNIRWLALLCAAGTVLLVVLYYTKAYYGDLWVSYIGWNTILVWLVLGRRFLNYRTVLTDYLNRASYPIYILHQSILVGLAYYVVRCCDSLFVQAAFICLGSFGLTLLVCEIYHALVCLKLSVTKRYGQ